MAINRQRTRRVGSDQDEIGRRGPHELHECNTTSATSRFMAASTAWIDLHELLRQDADGRCCRRRICCRRSGYQPDTLIAETAPRSTGGAGSAGELAAGLRMWGHGSCGSGVDAACDDAGRRARTRLFTKAASANA